MSAPLTWDLAIALDLATLAFITRAPISQQTKWAQHGIIPGDGDVTIPLCARMGSAGLFLFRLSLRAIGGLWGGLVACPRYGDCLI